MLSLKLRIFSHVCFYLTFLFFIFFFLFSFVLFFFFIFFVPDIRCLEPGHDKYRGCSNTHKLQMHEWQNTTFPILMCDFSFADVEMAFNTLRS